MNAKMYIHVLCPKCGLVMANNPDGETMSCIYKRCGMYGRKFKRPVVELVSEIQRKDSTVVEVADELHR